MRWFGHPLIVGGLAALLVVDFLSIPSGNANTSVAQRVVLGNLRPSTMHGRPLSGILCRTDNGLEWVWSRDERHAAIARQRLPGHEDLYATVFFDLVRREGLYHLTRRRETLTIWSDRMRPAEWDQAPQIIAAAIDASEDTARTYARHRELLELPPGPRTAGERQWIRLRPLYGGYLRNVAALAILGLMIGAVVFGRTWLWQPVRLRMQTRRRRRAQRGLCPRCGYDRAGLAGGPCPECGAPGGIALPGDNGASRGAP
jgi:hypothetical protein